MKEKHVLLVVGEQSRKETLTIRLQQEKFIVNAVSDGDAALDMSRKQKPDIAVIDFSLPTMSGTELVASLRTENGNVFPILVLVDERTSWLEKVDVIRVGADETLHEANIQKLEEQVGALIQRWSQPSTGCGKIHLDNRTQAAEFEGRLLDLTAYEYKVLEYLVDNRGQWMSGVSIVEHLYKKEYDRTDGAVNVVAEFVRRLTEKMDPEGARQPIDISDQGYRISCS